MNDRGMSIVEVLIVIALLAIISLGFVRWLTSAQDSTVFAGQRARTVLLAEEGLEATRNIRDGSYTSLTDGTHGLGVLGGVWAFTGSSDTTGDFTRAVTIASVDSNRKTITSTITWPQTLARIGVVTLVTRLTNWLSTNLPSWVDPIQEASVDITANQDFFKVQTAGNYAYAIRGAGTPDFVVIDVTNPATPSVVGSLTLTGNPQNLFVSGSYAYVANEDNSQELQIIDISTPSTPGVVGTFNNAGNINTTGVYVVGTTAYMTFAGNNEFSIVDVTVSTAPVLLGTLNLTGDANEIVISGTYAFLSSDNNSEELQVIDISTPTLPVQVASLNLSSAANADTISISGSTIYIGQGDYLHMIDVLAPTVPALLGSVNIGDSVNDIALDLATSNTYLFLATNSNSQEFVIIDVTTPATPIFLSSVDTTGNDNLFGVAYNATLDRAFGVGAINAQEFIVFMPQ